MKVRSVAALCFVAVLLVFWVGLTAYSQEDITFVEDSGFSEKMRSPVPFVHDEHNENAGIEECNVCHHVWENGKLVEYESSEDMECSECHPSENDRDDPYMHLLNVYHLLCKGCHQEQKQGPVLCSECHVKP
jgi:hypothetical protein